MVFKELSIEGVGSILYQPVKVEEQELENVAPDGSPVERTTIGERAKTVYKTADGTEIGNTSVCKKLVIDGETIIIKKFNASKQITHEEIEYLDGKDIVWNAIERKFYVIRTQSSSLKKMVMEEGKTIVFPFSAGNGFKVWKAALTTWNNQIAMVLCRGDVSKAFEAYDDQEVELTIDVMPEVQNKKKLLATIMA